MGLFDLINIPFSYVIKLFYALTDNYMLALLGFAIVVKLVLFPVGIKTQKNMVKQASLRPKEAAIRAKYAGRTDQATQQKMQNEIMTLYQEEHYNPAGGCLPMIVQLLVIWAIYKIVYGPLTYLCSMSAESIGFLKTAVAQLLEQTSYTGNEIQLLSSITELGIPSVLSALPSVEGCTAEIIAGIEDILLNHWPNMTVFGGALDLSKTPTVALNVLLLVPILNLVTTWASSKITKKLTYRAPTPQGSPDTSMKIMEITMPLMIFWMAFQLPAALGVYWIFQNVLGVLQQVLLAKIYPYPVFTEEELAQAVKESKKAAKNEKKATENKKIRSLHYIDDEDYVVSDVKKAEKTAPAEADSEASSESDGEKQEAEIPENAETQGVGYAPLKKDDRKKK